MNLIGLGWFIRFRQRAPKTSNQFHQPFNCLAPLISFPLIHTPRLRKKRIINKRKERVVELVVCFRLFSLAAEHWLASQPITAAGSKQGKPTNSLRQQFHSTPSQRELNWSCCWLAAGDWRPWCGVCSFHSIVIHKFKFFIPFQTLNLFISFHFIHFTHKLTGPPIQSHSFHSINCSFDFSNWWWNERLWAHYTATDLRQQIKNYSTIS